LEDAAQERGLCARRHAARRQSPRRAAWRLRLRLWLRNVDVDGLLGLRGGGWRCGGTRLARRVQVRSIYLSGGTRLGFGQRTPLGTLPLGATAAVGDS